MNKTTKALIKFFIKEQSSIKSVFIILLLTRLLFLEDNQLYLLSEIIGGLVILFTGPTAKDFAELSDNVE